MVNVWSRTCRTEGCNKESSFGVAGTKKGEYCAQHAPDGMVNVKNRKCPTEGCGKRPSFRGVNAKTVEYCAQHARLQYGVEGYREREVGLHHSGKETIGDVIPSCAKHTTIHSPPKRSQQSGVFWDSRKRVRYPESTSTGSKRVAAREPSAEAVAMPDIDGERSTVKRNYSVKVEVQLSF
ncbi:unnamed protein product [Ascophyllum nodosum]